MDWTFLLTLISVTLGWVLAQGTNVARHLWRRHVLSNALLKELEDVRNRLQETCTNLEWTLQIYALGGIDNSLPLEVHHYVFREFYPEASLGLNSAQRLSYQLIHGHITSLNAGLENLRRNHPVTAKNLKEGQLEEWGEYAKGLYYIAPG